MSEDTCPNGQWLVLANSDADSLICQPKPCSNDHILVDGKCQHFSASICSGHGQVWVLSHSGSAVCLCEQGFVRGGDGNCHQIFTEGVQGYCKDGNIVPDINNMAICVANPCPAKNYPHFKTWNGRIISIGDALTCHLPAENISDCELVDIDEDSELF